MIAIYGAAIAIVVATDVITLGKDQAINLGVDYDRCVRHLLLGVTLCIAGATTMVGSISFLGLIIANLSQAISFCCLNEQKR